MTDGSEALITAMHATGGSTPRPVSEWLTLAQEHAALRDAFRASHGKRLPTPQKFGLWLSERLGKTAGPLRLEGQYSGRKKAWVYRVNDYVKLAELARQEAERQAQIRAQFEESQRQRIAAAKAAALQAHEPPPAGHFTPLKDKPAPEQFVCETKISGTGVITSKPMFDSHGEPIRVHPYKGGSMLEGAKLFKTQREYRDGQYWTVECWMCVDGQIRENWVSPAGTNNGQDWQPAGATGRPTRAQLAARHHQSEAPADRPRPSAPGLPLPGPTGANGVRQPANPGSTLWNRTLKGL
jgi:hypothetical protein